MLDRTKTIDELYSFINRVLHKSDLEEVQSEDICLILKDGRVLRFRLIPKDETIKERLRLVKPD